MTNYRKFPQNTQKQSIIQKEDCVSLRLILSQIWKTEHVLTVTDVFLIYLPNPHQKNVQKIMG